MKMIVAIYLHLSDWAVTDQLYLLRNRLLILLLMLSKFKRIDSFYPSWNNEKTHVYRQPFHICSEDVKNI